MMLLTGCGGAEVSEPEFEGVRVLMRYDFDIQEYASVDSAQREMERWVGCLQYRIAGGTIFPERSHLRIYRRPKEDIWGYLDCGDIENFAGVHVYNHGIAWERENQMMVTEAATGEEVTLDESFLASLPESYEIVYGPVESLLMGSDRIILELNGLVRYVSAGWTPEGNQAASRPGGTV